MAGSPMQAASMAGFTFAARSLAWIRAFLTAPSNSSIAKRRITMSCAALATPGLPG